jgi:hypothetical protein
MSHGYESKRFPMTPAQGRVLYHAERIFRSAGGPGCLAAQTWRDACAEAALPLMVDTWTHEQCLRGLRLIEWAARKHRMHLFRNCSTGWQDFERRRALRAPEPVRGPFIWWAAEAELL